MKKMLLVIPVVVLLASLVLAVTAFACGPCPPPEPPCDSGCSPGYWKNHDFWMSDPQWEGGDWGSAAHMMEILWAKGNDPLFADRFNVMYDLNHAGYDVYCND